MQRRNKMDAVPVKIFAKVRPLQQGEAVTSNLQVRQKTVFAGQQSCEFSEVFYGDENPRNVLTHSDMNRLVSKCLQGFNSSLLLFGETGSGASEFLAGSGGQGMESLVSAVSSALFSKIQLTSQERQSGSISGSAHGNTDFHIALKGFEVSGACVRDLSTSQQLSLEVFKFPGSGVKGLSGSSVGSSTEVVTHFQRMWSNRTLSHQSISQTLSLSMQVIVFDVLCQQPGLAGPVHSSLAILCLPGAEHLAEASSSTRQLTTRSPSASISSVRSLGHLIMKLSQNVDTAFHPEDTPLNLIMGNYLSANCFTNVLVTLKPTVEGSVVDKVLLYANCLKQIINFPVRNSPALDRMLKAVESRSRALYQRRSASEPNVLTRPSSTSVGVPVEEQLRSLLAANQALKAENTQLKLQSLMHPSDRERDSSQRSAVVSRNAQSLPVVPKESTPIHSRSERRFGQESGWYDADSLTMILDREHVMSRELERLRALLSALQSENQETRKENSDLKLQILSLTSREDSLQSSLAELKARCLHLQGKVKEGESFSLSHQSEEQDRAAINAAQLEKVHQDLRTTEEDLRKAEKCNKQLSAQLKRLNADYRQRLEQYIRDVTAYLRDNRSGMLPGKHLYVVLDLIDDLTSRHVESCREDLRYTNTSLELVQERERVLLEDISLLSSHIDSMYKALGEAINGGHLDQLLSRLTPPPKVHRGDQVQSPDFPRCPTKVKLGQEVLQAINKIVPAMMVAMETVQPSVEADMCSLLERFLELKLSLLKFSVEDRGSLVNRNPGNTSDPLVLGLKEQLKNVQKEKIAIQTRSQLLETEINELKKLLGLT